MRFARLIILACAFTLLLLWAAVASAESAWVLWVEAPTGSDQWSVVRIPTPKSIAKEECERQAQVLNDFELTIIKMERMGDESRDVFTCLPDTLDPRPEGALR